MTKPDQFRALAAELAPLQSQANKLKVQMMTLSADMSAEIVREAFPEARVIHVRALAEIKPSHMAQGAHDTVKAMGANGMSPTLVIVDSARCTIVLAIEEAGTGNKRLRK